MNSDFNEVNLCNRFPILSYSKSTKCFSINNGDLTSDELVNVRRTLMSELRMIIPQSYIKIDEIITGYYDQCLERYLYERLSRKYNNEDTCWRKYALNNKCLGWQEPNDPFDEKKKVEFYNSLRELHPMKNIDKNIIHRLLRDELGYVYGLSDQVITKDDNILSLFHNIEIQVLVILFQRSRVVLSYWIFH